MNSKSKYSICIIDDKIPISAGRFEETNIVNSSDLNTLLKSHEKDWEEEVVKNLVEILLAEKGYELYAFINPEFYFIYLENNLIRPDIIILDWDFPTMPKSMEQYLTEMLERSFNLIHIYTGIDRKHEIDNLINGQDYITYKKRLFLLHKEEDKSIDKLNKSIAKNINNYSFKFGRELRRKSIDAVDKILIELGKVTLNQINQYFKITNETNKDLIEFIGERFKNLLDESQFDSIDDHEEEQGTIDDPRIIKNLWSYRLYHYSKNKDNIVRRGDIIYNINKGVSNLFVVLSADCDLEKFWHKNYGYINLVSLHEINENNQDFYEKLKLTRKKADIKSYLFQQSLTTPIQHQSEGPFILPFLKINDKYNNYLAIPNELISVKISNPIIERSELKKQKLKYEHWNEYKRIALISEPFLTPLIEHILKAISGYGVPDYTESVQTLIKEENKGIIEKIEWNETE